MNRTDELASWDDDALGPILQVLATEGALEGTGFTSDELDEVLASRAIRATLAS
jgi:hypothetical protein